MLNFGVTKIKHEKLKLEIKMNTKFTPGPWQILPTEKDKEYVRIRGTVPGSRYKVANVIDLKIHHDGSKRCELERSKSQANARLIACAPDMYAEIKRDIECLTRWIDNHGDAFPMTVAWKDMRANKIDLLKRARGE